MTVSYSVHFKDGFVENKNAAACYSTHTQPSSLRNADYIFVYDIWKNSVLERDEVKKFLDIITSIKFIKPLLSKSQIQSIIEEKNCTFKLKEYKNGLQLFYILNLIRLLSEFVKEVKLLCKLRSIKHRFSNLYFLCLVLNHRTMIGHNPHLCIKLDSFENKKSFYKNFTSNENFKTLFLKKRPITCLTIGLQKAMSYNSTYKSFGGPLIYFYEGDSKMPSEYSNMISKYGGNFFEK